MFFFLGWCEIFNIFKFKVHTMEIFNIWYLRYEGNILRCECSLRPVLHWLRAGDRYFKLIDDIIGKYFLDCFFLGDWYFIQVMTAHQRSLFIYFHFLFSNIQTPMKNIQSKSRIRRSSWDSAHCHSPGYLSGRTVIHWNIKKH